MNPALRPASPLPSGVPDLVEFVTDVVSRVNAGAWGRDPNAPDEQRPVFIARAPGRLDVMGGIADYSGILGLQCPIREATHVAIRPWTERRLSILSIVPGGLERR